MTNHRKLASGMQVFAADVAKGFVAITHNSFALLGVGVACATLALAARPDLRQAGEEELMGWLQSRQMEVLGFATEPTASDRATASNPKHLPKEQAAVANWLSKKYRVAPEPLSALVTEAYQIGRSVKLEPTLILAIMAVESSFNPFAQSAVGAQGLMQVMTKIHTDKYRDFGGHFAAFDPVANLRVGVQVLKECIDKAGTIEGGLRFYVGAANLADDGGYSAKVMAEHQRLRRVAAGQAVPTITPPLQATSVPAVAPARKAAPLPSRSGEAQDVALLSQ